MANKKKSVSLTDLQKAINDAVVLCYDKGISPDDTFVHICVVMEATEISVYLNGETVWIGGNNYLLPEEFENE